MSVQFYSPSPYRASWACEKSAYLKQKIVYIKNVHIKGYLNRIRYSFIFQTGASRTFCTQWVCSKKEKRRKNPVTSVHIKSGDSGAPPMCPHSPKVVTPAGVVSIEWVAVGGFSL